MNKNKNIINEFLDYKEHRRMCSVHTIRAYKSDLTQYSDFLMKYKKNLLDSESKHIQYYLNKITVKKEFRQKKIGKLLFLHCFKELLKRNVKCIQLEVSSLNLKVKTSSKR